jgi:hypothetical protein
VLQFEQEVERDVYSITLSLAVIRSASWVSVVNEQSSVLVLRLMVAKVFAGLVTFSLLRLIRCQASPNLG